MLSELAQPTEDPNRKAILLVAETVGDLMGFWNFKPSLGRVWTVLYLSAEPLGAEEIESITGLSSGNVSTSLQELMEWGAVQRLPLPGRRRLFSAETDVWHLVARVLRERELRLVERSIEHLSEAARILDLQRSSDPTAMLHNRFLASRVHNLLELAKAGHRMVDRLSRTGAANFRPIRDVLLPRRG